MSTIAKKARKIWCKWTKSKCNDKMKNTLIMLIVARKIDKIVSLHKKIGNWLVNCGWKSHVLLAHSRSLDCHIALWYFSWCWKIKFMFFCTLDNYHRFTAAHLDQKTIFISLAKLQEPYSFDVSLTHSA